MRIRTILPIFTLAALVCGGGRAQSDSPPPPPAPGPDTLSVGLPPGPLTLPDVIRMALANHNQIAIAESQELSAGARLTQSKSAYYPRITPYYQFNHQRFGRGRDLRGDSDTVSSAGIDLTQTIYDSGRRNINVARSGDAVRAAGFNTEDARQTVIVNVATAWFELRRRHELVRVAESSAERARTTLEATRAFAEEGTRPYKDVYQALADAENAQIGVIQARNNVLLAETTLRNAMGLPPLTPIEVAEATLAAPEEEEEERPVADLVAAAFAQRPDLKASEANLDATRRGVRLARIDAGPVVSSTLSTGLDVAPSSRYDTALVLGVTLPLFDAGASRAAVSEARASVDQAERQMELTRQGIAAEVESAYLVRHEAQSRIVASRSALAAARENYTAATESQKEGVGTILDVITAQNQLVTAETSSVQAVYDYFTADARLQYALGGIDTLATGGGAP